MARTTAGTTIITYCENCGILVRGQGMEDPVLCPECKAGRKRASSYPRDSGRIPYSHLPSPESILQAIHQKR
jgi:anaerobic ribonucleoside-triphosphate reductase